MARQSEGEQVTQRCRARRMSRLRLVGGDRRFGFLDQASPRGARVRLLEPQPFGQHEGAQVHRCAAPPPAQGLSPLGDAQARARVR